jgi:hypothetical protein
MTCKNKQILQAAVIVQWAQVAMNSDINGIRLKRKTGMCEKERIKKHTLHNSRSNMWSDNKVRELITMCLLWQQWTETSVWFDDVGISAFHSYVVVDLWHSLSERCSGVLSQDCQSFLLNLARVEAKSERCWCKCTGIML